MSNGIGGILAIPQHIGKRGISCGRLVPAKGPQQIGKLMPRNFKFTHSRPQSDKNWMPRIPGVALLQFRFPLIEQGQRLLWIAYSVAQIVRYPAVGINIVEM